MFAKCACTSIVGFGVKIVGHKIARVFNLARFTVLVVVKEIAVGKEIQ